MRLTVIPSAAVLVGMAAAGVWWSTHSESDYNRAVAACADAQGGVVRGRPEVSYGSNTDAPSAELGWRVWLAPRGGNTKRCFVTEQDGVLKVSFMRDPG